MASPSVRPSSPRVLKGTSSAVEPGGGPDHGSEPRQGGQRPSVRLQDVTAFSFYVLLTLGLTWPQAIELQGVAQHIDPYFSVWRLAWIAHALSTAPGELFNGNIFFPERGTLLYSDAVLVQGLLGWPLTAAGVPAPSVYNVLLLASFAASAGAMYVLAREVTGSRPGALVAGVIFGFAPFRFDHYVHLELLWGWWIPLTLWAVHRALDRSSVRYGVLSGVFAVLQLASSIYYAVFLSTVLVVVCTGLLFVRLYREPRRWRGLALGGVIAAAGAAAYAVPYLDMAEQLGARRLPEIDTHSPTLVSFLASPEMNRLYGWTSALWGGNEGHLFVGLGAVVLTVVALAACRRAWVAIYGVLLALAVLITLGMNGPIYRWLYHYWPGFDGLRVPSRFGLIVLLAVSLLAAGGLKVLLDRLQSSRQRAVLLVLATAILIAEYSVELPALEHLDSRRPYVYSWLAEQQDAVVLELPVPPPNALPGEAPRYMWLSTFHWRPLVNGYSGHYPRSHVRLMSRLRTFPDERSLQALRDLAVKYVIVHERGQKPYELSAMLLAMHGRREFRPVAEFQGAGGERLYVWEILKAAVVD